MGALLEPVGPLGAATYWRRRLVVIAVLLVAVWLVSRIGGDDGSASAAAQREVSVTEPDPTAPAFTPSLPAAGPVATASPPATGEPTEPPADGSEPGGARGVQVCSDDELELSVVSSTARYAKDVKPTLALAVQTTGKAPCTRDLGPTQVALEITSGQDRIWASRDCATAKPDVRVLTPGAQVTLQVTWDRVRSTPGCSSAGAAARPGTYVATPVAGEQTGPAVSFLLD